MPQISRKKQLKSLPLCSEEGRGLSRPEWGQGIMEKEGELHKLMSGHFCPASTVKSFFVLLLFCFFNLKLKCNIMFLYKVLTSMFDILKDSDDLFIYFKSLPGGLLIKKSVLF